LTKTGERCVALERENIHDQIRFAIQQNDVAAD